MIKSFSSKINSLEQTRGLVCQHFIFSGWDWPSLRSPSPLSRSLPAPRAQRPAPALVLWIDQHWAQTELFCFLLLWHQSASSRDSGKGSPGTERSGKLQRINWMLPWYTTEPSSVSTMSFKHPQVLPPALGPLTKRKINPQREKPAYVPKAVRIKRKHVFFHLFPIRAATEFSCQQN